MPENIIFDENNIFEIRKLCKDKEKKSITIDKTSIILAIESLEKAKFWGLVIVNFGDLRGAVMFDNGEVKVVHVQSVDGKEADITELRGEGTLEIYPFSSAINHKTREISSEKNKKTEAYSVEHIEKLLEAYKIIKDFGIKKIA